MSSSIQLICTDFDGTLFAEVEDPPVPERLQRLIGRMQGSGAKWVINTGRDLTSLVESLERALLGIKPDYVVVVEREIYERVGPTFVGHDAWNGACHAAHAKLFKQVRADLPRITAWIHERFNATVYEDFYSPFCLIAETNADAEAIHEFLDEYCREVPHLTVVRNDIYARFSHAAFNKGTALSEVARLLGLAPGQVFAAGDHLNDLPMLERRHARWLGAPHNAIEAVKTNVLAQEGRVSPLFHGYGVADALEHCLRANGQTEAAAEG